MVELRVKNYFEPLNVRYLCAMCSMNIRSHLSTGGSIERGELALSYESIFNIIRSIGGRQNLDANMDFLSDNRP